MLRTRALGVRRLRPTHQNWASIKTQKSRITTINRSEEYYRVWLRHIGGMSEANLYKNTLGLDGATVKKMALVTQQSL